MLRLPGGSCFVGNPLSRYIGMKAHGMAAMYTRARLRFLVGWVVNVRDLISQGPIDLLDFTFSYTLDKLSLRNPAQVSPPDWLKISDIMGRPAAATTRQSTSSTTPSDTSMMHTKNEERDEEVAGTKEDVSMVRQLSP